MKRCDLEKFLQKTVTVLCYDGYSAEGELHKTGEALFRNDPNLYLPHNYYFCTAPGTAHCISHLFRSSMVKKIFITSS